MKTKFRKANEEDLKNYKYDPLMNCASCELDGKITIGAYRCTDFYLCKECFLEGVSFDCDD